jgi:hypothetical protein
MNRSCENEPSSLCRGEITINSSRKNTHQTALSRKHGGGESASFQMREEFTEKTKQKRGALQSCVVIGKSFSFGYSPLSLNEFYLMSCLDILAFHRCRTYVVRWGLCWLFKTLTFCKLSLIEKTILTFLCSSISYGEGSRYNSHCAGVLFACFSITHHSINLC